MSLRTMRALRECAKRGIHCVPCSGRSADMFPPQIDGNLIFRYWVSAAGARVLDRLTGEVLYKQTFTPEQSAELCTLYEGQHIYSEIAAEGKLYFEQDVLDELWKYPVPPHHVWYLETGRQVGVHGRLSDFSASRTSGLRNSISTACLRKSSSRLPMRCARGRMWNSSTARARTSSSTAPIPTASRRWKRCWSTSV